MQLNVSTGMAESSPSWSKWYQPGSEDDAVTYARALKKCKEINEQLKLQPWLIGQQGLMATKVIESAPIRLTQPKTYSAAWVESLIRKESERLENKQASKKIAIQQLNRSVVVFIKFATQMKPVIDIFVPQSPEYSVPYACLWAIFKGIADRTDKVDSVQGLINCLSQDIPILEVYKDMFPTNDMKQALVEFYIHTLDLLWRLSMYYSHNFLKQLADAMLPRTKYNFSIYLENVKKVAARLKTLCEAGHIAEQKHIARNIESLGFGLETLQSVTDNLHVEVRSLKRQLQALSLAQSRYYSSKIFDTWNDDIGNVEEEFRKWQALRFFTDMRDHWSQNGLLPCLAEWRELCDNSQNSILWVSTENNGRQFWLTEFSINFINVCRSQGQLIAFAMCDRPEGAKWTSQQILKQLILQLLNSRPSLAVSAPDIISIRNFRRAKTFDAILKLLHSIVVLLGPVIIVIDRLDKCILDPAAQHPNVVDALSLLVNSHPRNLKIIVTTGQIVLPLMLPGLPISFAVFSTKRRRRIQEDNLVVRKTNNNRAPSPIDVEEFNHSGSKERHNAQNRTVVGDETNYASGHGFYAWSY